MSLSRSSMIANKSKDTNKGGAFFIPRDCNYYRTQPVPEAFKTESGENSKYPGRYYWFLNVVQADVGLKRVFLSWAESEEQWAKRMENKTDDDNDESDNEV